MNLTFTISPHKLKQIIDLRYEVLRKPWQQPYDTSTDGLEENAYNALLEDEPGIVLACGRLQVNTNITGQIRYMAVKDGNRGKGLGQMILNALEKKAAEIGLKEIELQSRENAVEFYKKNGYHVVEKSFVLWGIIQHYLMRKTI
jgi:N-acetylglutamate synthase-like GNAT family acetyltransferase